MVTNILEPLGRELEAKVSLTTPQDVRVWRVQCLVALAPAITQPHRKMYMDTLWRLTEQTPRIDFQADIHVRYLIIDLGEY